MCARSRAGFCAPNVNPPEPLSSRESINVVENHRRCAKSTAECALVSAPDASQVITSHRTQKTYRPSQSEPHLAAPLQHLSPSWGM